MILFFCQGLSNHFSLVPVGMTVLSTHVLGMVLLSSPQVLGSLGLEFGLSTDTSVYVGYLVMSLSLLVIPLFAGRYVISVWLNIDVFLKCSLILFVYWAAAQKQSVLHV